MNVEIGDYVLATKYHDGDPHDDWCVGFYDGLTNPEYNPPRYNIIDIEGRNFRGNGFRRIKKISKDRGKWILENKKNINLSGKSLWFFSRCKINE